MEHIHQPGVPTRDPLRAGDMQDPFVLTLGMDRPSFERLDALRRRYFPPERNIVPSHLSLFHKLPAIEAKSIDTTLREISAITAPIHLRFARVRSLGFGMAVAVEAAGLSQLHADLARRFHAWLTPQDRQGFRPHVTIMNKAERLDAVLAFAEARELWEVWDGLGQSLVLWRYLGGPWRWEAEYPLRGDCGTTVS